VTGLVIGQFQSCFITVDFLSMLFRNLIRNGLEELKQVVPEGYTNMQSGFAQVCVESFPQVLALSLENYMEYLTISSMSLSFLLGKQTDRTGELRR
jgi:hypothetical protein